VLKLIHRRVAQPALVKAEGAHVVVSGRRKAPLEAVVAEITKAGGKAVARAGDVSRPEQGGPWWSGQSRNSAAWTS
jgi:NAD(P)-dependent dehydrogenase (short-subunit alcohol dehydrogenase family)